MSSTYSYGVSYPGAAHMSGKATLWSIPLRPQPNHFQNLAYSTWVDVCNAKKLSCFCSDIYLTMMDWKPWQQRGSWAAIMLAATGNTVSHECLTMKLYTDSTAPCYPLKTVYRMRQIWPLGHTSPGLVPEFHTCWVLNICGKHWKARVFGNSSSIYSPERVMKNSWCRYEWH